MKKQLNLLFLLFSLAFVGQLSAVKSIEALYEQTQKIVRRSVKCTRSDYLAGVVRCLKKMQSELAGKTPETLDQAVTTTFLNEFLPLLLDFNHLQIRFYGIAANDYAALVVLADRADRLYCAVVAHGPQGLAIKKFGADHELMVRSTKAFWKKILTAQLFIAIGRVDVEAVRDLLARGADANGTNVQGQSPMDVAYLIPAIPDHVNRADADACDRAAAAKMTIQSILIDHEANTRTVDIDALCARLAAQRVAAQRVADVPVEPEAESEEDAVVEEEAAVAGVDPVVITPPAEPKRAARGNRRNKGKKKRRGRKSRRGQQAGPARVDQVEPVQEEEFNQMRRKKTREMIIDLIDAMQQGKTKKLEKLLKCSLKLPPFSVNDVEVVGAEHCMTPLICFAAYQDNGSLELLLKYKDELKLDLELRGTDERTPLHITIFRGCVPLEQALVRAGADVNASSRIDEGSNTLHAALMVLYEGYTNDERIFLTLLESAGPIDLECGAGGVTALQVAATFKRPALVRALIGAGADINAPSKDGGQTPLMLTVCSEDHLSARLLLEAGADCRLADKRGITPLHQAAGVTDVEMVKLILKFPNLIDINQRTKIGSTVLQVLCCRELAVRDLALAHCVILAGADLNATCGSMKGSTVLNWACTRPDFELVKFMCEHGADVDSVDSHQRCPLLVAQRSWRGYCRTGQIGKAGEAERIIKYLKLHGACLDDGGAGVDGGGA